MKLAELRRLAVRQHLRIRFSIEQGLECVVDERGVVRIPTLNSIPKFNVEEELTKVIEFRLEPAVPSGNDAAFKTVTRQELEAMTGTATRSAAAQHEED